MLKKLLIGILIGLLVLSAIIGATYGIHKHNSKKAAEEEMTTEYEAEVIPEAETDSYGIDANDPLRDLKLSLVVDLDRQTLEEIYSGYSKEFLDSSMPNRNDERTSAASYVGWGKEGYKMYDAVSFPFRVVEKGKTKYSNDDIQVMLSDVREEIMRNPVFLDMFLQGMRKWRLLIIQQ
jgi:hypothetical protein